MFDLGATESVEHLRISLELRSREEREKKEKKKGAPGGSSQRGEKGRENRKGGKEAKDESQRLKFKWDSKLQRTGMVLTVFFKDSSVHNNDGAEIKALFFRAAETYCLLFYARKVLEKQIAFSPVM